MYTTYGSWFFHTWGCPLSLRAVQFSPEPPPTTLPSTFKSQEAGRCDDDLRPAMTRVWEPSQFVRSLFISICSLAVANEDLNLLPCHRRCRRLGFCIAACCHRSRHRWHWCKLWTRKSHHVQGSCPRTKQQQSIHELGFGVQHQVSAVLCE